MRQSEFETRVHMNVTAEEYSHIEEVYMNSDLDKDEFCKMWSKMNQTRIQKAKEEAKRLEEESKLRDQLYNIINRNHDKAYNIFAEDYFNKGQQRILANIGIGMTEVRVEPIFGHTVRDHKLVSTVLYEIKKYLKVA